MLSAGQVYVLNAGDSASLDCVFHADAYNLFDYPVLWRKTQRDEETQVCTGQPCPFVDEAQSSVCYRIILFRCSEFCLIFWKKLILKAVTESV